MSELEYLDVDVEGVSLSPMGFAVHLRPAGVGRVLSIFIGPSEAQSIALALQKQAFPRPLTHDLFRVALEELGGQVTRVLIESVQDGTYFATLHLEQAGLEMVLDARPSDAIALALRFQAPIAVREDVWDLASQESPLDEDAVLEGRESSARDVLTQALQEAVAAERYEEAARLRDELRKLPGDN